MSSEYTEQYLIETLRRNLKLRSDPWYRMWCRETIWLIRYNYRRDKQL